MWHAGCGPARGQQLAAKRKGGVTGGGTVNVHTDWESKYGEWARARFSVARPLLTQVEFTRERDADGGWRGGSPTPRGGGADVSRRFSTRGRGRGVTRSQQSGSDVHSNQHPTSTAQASGEGPGGGLNPPKVQGDHINYLARGGATHPPQGDDHLPGGGVGSRRTLVKPCDERSEERAREAAI